MSCRSSPTENKNNENYYDLIKSAEEEVASNENYAKKSDFKGFEKFFFGEKNNKVLSILGLGKKLEGFTSKILVILSFQLDNIDNLP